MTGLIDVLDRVEIAMVYRAILDLMDPIWIFSKEIGCVREF